MWEAILFLYDFTAPEASRQGGGRARNGRHASMRPIGRSTSAVSRCPDRVVVCRADADRRARRAPEIGTEAQRESGKKLYAKNCSQCHGEKGDGEGYAAPHLYPRPRNFTTGKFKIRTTPNGALPTHQDLVNIIKRGMPYTSMPAWPNLSDQEVSDLAYFITTFSPDFSDAGNAASPFRSRARRAATKESVELGKKLLRGDRLRKVPRHARSGRRTFGSNPDGRLGLSDTRGGPRAELDLPRRVVPRGHLPGDEHGIERHADAVVLRRAERSSNDGRSQTSSTPSREATGLAIPTSSSPSTSTIRSTWPRGPRTSNPLVSHAFRSSDRSPSPDARSIRPTTSVTVQAIYDAESIALLVRWHDMSAQKTGKNGPSLPVPPEEEEEPAAGAGASGGASAGGSEGSVFGDAEVAPTPPGSRRRQEAPSSRSGPLCRGGTGAGRPAIRVLRRRRDPDSVAGADRRPQALLHFWRRPEPGGSLVLRSGPPRSPPVHRPGKRGDRSERHGGCHRCRELRPGRMVRHFQAAASGQLGRPVLARRVHARSPSRSGTGSRASVATGEASRSGTRSTSGPKRCRRLWAR